MGSTSLRGAVGMRNAIIHDYLNLDWRLLETVLSEARYRRVNAFVEQASKLLLANSQAQDPR